MNIRLPVACFAACLALSACSDASPVAPPGPAISPTAPSPDAAPSPAPPQPPAPASPPPAPPASLDDVKRDTGQALSTTGDYIAAKKDDAIAAGKVQLDKMGAQLAEWKKQAEPAAEDAKQRFKAATKELEDKLAVARQKLAAAKDSAADAWNDAAPKLKKSLDETRSYFQKLKDSWSAPAPAPAPTDPPATPPPAKA